MYRAVTAATTALLLGLAGLPEARGVEGAPPRVKVETNATISVRDSDEVPGHTAPAAAAPRPRPAGPTWTLWILSFGEGGFCRQRRTTRVERVADALRAYSTWEMTLPVCPRAARPDPVPVADGLAQEFWDSRLLPSPVLESAPAYAITGKALYLQIHGEQTRTFQVDNPVGDDVAITAASTYVVDWGDGSFPHATSSQGGPWPSGDVTHTYTDTIPAITITVTQHWAATWAAGTDGGVLQGLATTAALTLPVLQVQAVLNR